MLAIGGSVPTGGAPPPPPPPPPSAPAGGDGARRRDPTVVWLLGGLAAVLVVAVVVLMNRSGDDAPATTLGLGETPGEVFLEPAGTLGPDSFTLRVAEGPVVATTAPLVPTTTRPPAETTTTAAETTTTAAGEPSTIPVPPPTEVESRQGGEPGLYGGTLDNSRCDKEAILSFLEQNPDKAAAWVQAQNSDPTLRWDDGRTSLTVADLRAFFDELTPVTLLYDTRVTNHGYRDGRPTPRQSVLQAGTAVLIDRYGVPRVRCACGNPLIPPVPSPVPPGYVGPQWPGFDPTIIIVVIPAPVVITEIVIIDLTTGTKIIRIPGSVGDQDVVVTTSTTTTTTTTTTTLPPLTIPPDITVGTGDVQVTLIWATDSDMDLHVIDPDGFEIYFSAMSAPSGGVLDVDDIPSSGDTGPHVENVFWPTGGAPSGRYAAFVYHFSGTAPSGYTLEVRVGDVVVHTETGVLAPGDSSAQYEFVVG